MTAIRVVVADDQRVVREGLGTLLGLLAGVEVVGTAADGDEALALAIRLRGQAAIDPAVQQHLVNAIAAGSSTAAAPQLPAGLTPREAEVLALIAQGLSNTEIAARLVVSETTVKSHVNHLFAKTGVRDRAQAVTYAYQHGLT